MAGLYFHIPFCKRLCAYCDFFHSVELGRGDALVEAMHRELEAAAPFLSDRHVRTIYFGGGTPSLLPPARLQELMDHAAALLDCSAVEERTMEANPDDLDGAYLEALARTEIDRLSVGVQSFDDGALRLMNRRHTAAQAEQALRRAQEAGFRNVTLDLIFGIPGFGEPSLRQSLEKAVGLAPGHISAYHLTIEPATAFGRRAARGTFGPVDGRTSEREYALVHETLTAAGYCHYEVSNYAREGFRARHNSAYWTGDEYLGIGPSAHSFARGIRRWGVASLEEYLRLAGTDALYGSEWLSERDRYNECVMTGLRTAEGVDPDRIGALFGERRRERFLREAGPLEAAGLLVRHGVRLAIPAERFLLSDSVIERFFEV